jgi:glycosyltransferase involved in cell wall biosynthesis
MQQHQAAVTPTALAASSRLRLLLVSSDTYPPTRVDITVLFGAEFADRGHRIDMILQSEGACRRAYVTDWSGGQVWVGATDAGASLMHRIRKHLIGLWHDTRLFGRLHSGDYDLIVVKDKFLSGIMGLLGALLYKRRFIYWLSYPFPEMYLERARDGTSAHPWLYWVRGTTFQLLLYRLLLPRAAHVFVQSEQMFRDIESHGIAAAKMTPVPMGIQPHMFSIRTTDAARVRHAGDGPWIVYIGTLARIRRLEFLLRVLVRVRTVAKTARLILVGRGDDPMDESLLLDEARELRLDIGTAVELTGQLPRAEALQYVAAADVCVSPVRRSPSLNAGSPTKLIEYMAMGKAVVANDQPEQRSLIEQSGAGYCVPYDEQAFADAILKIAADPVHARQMGQRGRDYVLRHRNYAEIASLVEREMLRLAVQGSRSSRH